MIIKHKYTLFVFFLLYSLHSPVLSWGCQPYREEMTKVGDCSSAEKKFFHIKQNMIELPSIDILSNFPDNAA